MRLTRLGLPEIKRVMLKRQTISLDQSALIFVVLLVESSLSEAVRVIYGKNQRTEQGLKFPLVDVNWRHLFCLRQFCTTFCWIALLVNCVRAVEEFSRKKELFRFKVTGLAYIHRSLGDKPVVLTWADFLLTRTIFRNFKKFRVCRGVKSLSDLVNIIYLWIRHKAVECFDFLKSWTRLVGELERSVIGDSTRAATNHALAEEGSVIHAKKLFFFSSVVINWRKFSFILYWSAEIVFSGIFLLQNQFGLRNRGGA